MTYEVGLGDSPSRIAGYLSGNSNRYPELLRANPHKRVVYVGGMPTFESLGVGECLTVPPGFVGKSLCQAFGVGTPEEAFERLEQVFGAGATPESAFDALERTFGTSDEDDDYFGVSLSGYDVGVLGLFDGVPILGDVEKAVTGAGKAIGKGAKAIGNVAKGAVKETQKALTSAAKFVAKAGGDTGKFFAKQAKNFAKDPMGSLAKIASTGGLSLIGVDPQKALAEVGIPTPDTMLKKLGLPTTQEVTTVAFRGITNPKEVLDRVPGLNELTKYIPDMPDPAKMAGRLVDAAMRGDLKALKTEALAIGHLVSDVASMVPGVGNVIGAPLASAITLLETGSALKAALTLMLNQVPGIPPPIRDILRVALNAIADIVEKSKSVTDVLLAEFKKGVREQAKKKGISGPIADVVESVLDGAIQLIFKSKPLDKAALDIAKDGLEVAKKNVAKGIGSAAEVKEAANAVADLEKVYDKVRSEHALTQGIIKLMKKDPQKKNPKIQKQIRDLQASIEGEKLHAQSGAKAMAATLKKRAFESLQKLPPKQQEELRKLAELKRLSPAQQEELRQLSAMQQMTPQQQEELRQLAALKKLSPEEQEAVREIAAMKKMSPEEQEELRQVAALKKLSPEERQQLAAMTPEQRAQLRESELAKLDPKEREDLREIAAKKKAPTAAAPAPARVTYGPYPQAAA